MLCIAAFLWNKPKQVKDNIKKEKKWGFKYNWKLGIRRMEKQKSYKKQHGLNI